MKYVVMMCVLALFAGKLAVANEDAVEKSSDTSKNPITGTVTTKKKYKAKHKRADGSMHKVDATKTIKTKTDGSTTEKVDVEHEDTK